jgi:hypothetical protein
MNHYELIAFFGTYRFQVVFLAYSAEQAKKVGKDYEAYINRGMITSKALRIRVKVCLLSVGGYDFEQHKFLTQPTTIIWDSKG